ncbi:DUF4397 domain-containing protein [Mucilaginibacter psychrotolerans]|uniref:DUF4397 domain-containing protein n=1 Tax=Mucilaginibacter psychrotolerans TaxID=1524096 RepID=A0A4Y8S919_9SPHI|nr:DUF4397 domain-containing protein [Mucilaginibacter psychrotolerans]TFF34944.1 DUF4397 domain-containing protein [Mucilaginibacter psychrotolerans]
MNFKTIVFVLFSALAIAACNKGDDSVPTSSTLTTTLNVVNTTTDTLNYYLNGSRVNTTSSLYPFGYTGYLAVKYDDQDYQFKRLGSADVLFNLSLTLDTNKVYSLFVAGRAAEQTFTTLDTLTADTSGRARIRFVNASPDAGNLDVLIGDTVNFKVRAYKSASVFLPVGAGIKHVRVFQSGSATAISDTTRTLVAGRVYTLFAKGKLAGIGGAKFGTGLMVNK